MIHAPIRKRDRVRYVGKAVPALTGREGIVETVDGKGWTHVAFDPGFPVKCAQANLERIESESPL